MADVDQSHRTHAAKRRSQDESEPECRTEHSECTGALLRHAYPDKSFAAFVAKIYPEADRQKGTVKVEVKLRDPDLRIIKPEMSAKVTFMANEGHASAARLVIVPISSRRGSNKNRRRTMVAKQAGLLSPFSECRARSGGAAGRDCSRWGNRCREGRWAADLQLPSEFWRRRGGDSLFTRSMRRCSPARTCATRLWRSVARCFAI
jgi:hypothetical protein